jgi:hypothetical protein
MCYNVVCSPANIHATADCWLWQSESDITLPYY